MRRLLLVLALVAGCSAGPEAVRAPADGGTADASAFTSPWNGPDGQPAPQREGQGYSPAVSAYTGPAHCEWEPAVFLTVGWPLGTSPRTSAEFRQFLRDPEEAVGDGGRFLLGELDLDAEMPADATDTGYATDEAELWLGPDGGETYAYLKTAEGVERWPRAREAIACA